MSVGIAAAMVRAACKRQKVPGIQDLQEATKQFAPFQPQLLHCLEAFGADFIDSIAPVHRFLMQWLPPNIYSVRSCLGSVSQWPQVTWQKHRLAPIARHSAGKHTMKEEWYVEHAISLRTYKLPLIIFALINQRCSQSLTLRWQMQGHSRTGLPTKIAKATSLQAQPKSLISEEDHLYAWSNSIAISQSWAKQELSQTKWPHSKCTKELTKEGGEAHYQSRPWQLTKTELEHQPWPTHTTPQLEHRQLPTLTAWSRRTKNGDAIAMAAHAIGEGARAFSEGTNYEPKPPMFELDIQWANTFPEALHIGSGIAPGGHPQAENTREGQAGTETNTVSVRRPSDVSVKRPNTVFPAVP